MEHGSQERKFLRIGEAAKLAAVTPKAVRHYHKIGLLAEPARSENGYRLYTATDLLRLQRIRRLRDLGLPLKRIKTVLGEPGGERTLASVLKTLLGEVSAEIENLEERRKSIEEMLAEGLEDRRAAETVPHFRALRADPRRALAGRSERRSPGAGRKILGDARRFRLAR